MGCFDWLKKCRARGRPAVPELKPLPRKLIPRPAVTHDHFDQMWLIDRLLSGDDTVIRVRITQDETNELLASADERTYGTYVQFDCSHGMYELGDDGLYHSPRAEQEWCTPVTVLTRGDSAGE